MYAIHSAQLNWYEAKHRPRIVRFVSPKPQPQNQLNQPVKKKNKNQARKLFSPTNMC